jgi:hypothetical protein
MLGLVLLVAAQETPLPIGRWDLTVQVGNGTVPSWLEIHRTGNRTLVGQFVGAFGSARPVSEIKGDAAHFEFSIPVQWESGQGPIYFDGSVDHDALTGTLDGPFFGHAAVRGVRAPRLATPKNVKWGAPLRLINGKDLSAWLPTQGWEIRDGAATNARPGHNLISRDAFGDLKLHAEFRYRKGSNSGIYLRGRYEVQIDDAYGQEPDLDHLGAIYGFLVPREDAARPAETWQTLDVTLLGRRVTVVLNGKTVIDRLEIPGITGGALDSREGEPGPIMLQGDHGPVEFRSLVVTPARP